MLQVKVKEDVTGLPGVKCYSVDVGTIKERYIREASTGGSLSENDIVYIDDIHGTMFINLEPENIRIQTASASIETRPDTFIYFVPSSSLELI